MSGQMRDFCACPELISCGQTEGKKYNTYRENVALGIVAKEFIVRHLSKVLKLFFPIWM